MTEQELKRIIESILFAADEPVNLNQLQAVFAEDDGPDVDAIKAAIAALQEDYAEHSLELREVGSGYRFQVKQGYANWVSKLWEEKPARYSRAVLETLALIAYRQPITRGEIEEIRGVSVSTQIIKTLQEREWVKVVGHRDVPGKPALYATSKEFLDYFNLNSLQDLPPLAELRDIDSINAELDWGDNAGQSELSDAGSSSDEQDIESGDPDVQAEAASGMYADEAETETENQDNVESATDDETETASERHDDVHAATDDEDEQEDTRPRPVLSAEH